MSASPFAFFRGAAAVMAADLAATPVSGLRVQACGDAHLSNFGAFAAPDRRLVFDLNDFDESLPGPWEWDLKRLAASFAIAGRENGFKRKAAGRVLTQTPSAQYREAMRGFAGMRNLEVWYARLDEDAMLRAGRATPDPTEADQREREGGARRPVPRTACGRWRSSPSGVDGELRIRQPSRRSGAGRGAAGRRREASTSKRVLDGVLERLRGDA